MGFEETREEWTDLVKQAKFQEADNLYWNDLFPEIERRFLAHANFSQKCDWLILPCGLEDSYYILLIKALKPAKVYFIGTKEFKDSFLNKIIEKSGLKPSQYIIDEIEYQSMDVAEVYKKIRARLDLFIDKKIIMDLTRGKRVMSVGAGIVGAFFGFDLVYIDEDWIEDLKRGVPGTEKLVLSKNPFDVFGDLEGQEAKELFNNYDYVASIFFFKKLREKVADPREIEINELLAETYLYWGSFDFKAALEKIKLVLKKMQQYNITSSRALIESNFKALEILAKNVDLSPEQLDEEAAIHLMVDLYINAVKRAETGRYEDAVSRLYRLLELISQYRLAKYGIITSQPKLEKYNLEFREITKKLYGVERALPFEIGVKEGHILLFLIKDDIWKDKTMEDLKKFCGTLRLRDTSIIAHGLQLVGKKGFDNVKEMAFSFLEKMCKNSGNNIDKLINQHTFIRLR